MDHLRACGEQEARTWLCTQGTGHRPDRSSHPFLLAGDTTNRFLNEHWRELFDTFKHLAEQAFGILFKDLSNRVYSHFSYTELFPQ
jgi:hypothetical protein